ncbi:MAG: response regulator transcription factor [Vicinamibacterales bacterium]
MRLLIAEDEPDLARVLQRTCEDEGWHAETASDGGTALAMAHSGAYDLLILDLMLPVLDGWQVLARLRAQGQAVPVLVLTARDAIPDRVRGLDAGADDYLTKPFDRDELLARIRALIRRSQGHDGQRLRIGPLVIDMTARRVRGSDGEIDLTAREYDILALLARRRGHIVSRVDIATAVYDTDTEVVSNAIDVHVASLRRKLGAGLIHTRRGLGYLLDVGAGAEGV